MFIVLLLGSEKIALIQLKCYIDLASLIRTELSILSFWYRGVDGVADDSDSDDDNELRSAGGNMRVVDSPGSIEVDPESGGGRSYNSSTSGSSLGAESRTVEDEDDASNDSSRNSSSSSSNNHVRIKMADALELFHRILDIRSKAGTGARGVAEKEAGNDNSEGGGIGDDAANEAPMETGGGKEFGGSSEAGAGGAICESFSKGDDDDIVVNDDEVCEKIVFCFVINHFAQRKEVACINHFYCQFCINPRGISLYKSIDKKHRRGGSSEYFQICCQKLKGEDTFGDSEPEEDDVIVDNNSSDGVKPRMGIGASLQSLIHPGEGPICTLSDHPIQVRKLPLTEVGIGMPLNS